MTGVVVGSSALTGRVAVVSPHLDDAVLSLGAALAGAAGSGAAEITIVTVLAGDPAAAIPAGEWDARAGFRWAGEAALARRDEDREACRIIGATSVPLPFPDRQYEPEHDADAIWEALRRAVEGAGLALVPGGPLLHEDHAWVASLVARRGLVDCRLGWYAEQPYALHPQAAGLVESPDWESFAVTPAERLRKLRACSAYRSQVPLLGGMPALVALVEQEERRGGERIAWGLEPPLLTKRSRG